ncbi:hypothetical protein PIB30_070160, partial [Stylosanthes scabra]|nr:hypothetical protein [Stylosanthes scabra]
MGQTFPSVCLVYMLNKKGRHYRCPGWTRLLLTLEDHLKTPGIKACRERSTLGGHASTVSSRRRMHKH